MSNRSATHAIIPLALLEAVRNLDTPLDDGLPDLATETATRRLGMSATVAAQIERYREAAAQDRRVSAEEATQVFRLVGRRSDASLVYADAGRRAARLAAEGGRPSRLARWLLPRSARRSLGERRAIRLAARVFDLGLGRDAEGLGVVLSDSIATTAGFGGSGCHFYSALLGELLRVTSGFEGAMVHDSCVARGDRLCRWRTAEAETW